MLNLLTPNNKVVAQTEESSNTPAEVTTVEVNILNSPTLTLTVPAGLRLQDPAFIQYVAQEALGLYKQMARSDTLQLNNVNTSHSSAHISQGQVNIS